MRRSGRLRHDARLASGALLALLVGFAVFAPEHSGGVFTDTAGLASNTFATGTLAAPTTLTASASGSSIVLGWTATTTTGATGHRVYRATSGSGPFTQIAELTPRTNTTHSDSPGTGTWFYEVRAYVGGWESSSSNQASGTVAPPPTSGTISLVASAQGSAGTGVTTLTVAKPAGTSAGDLMVASIAVRPSTVTITAPSGWTLVRRTDNTSGNTHGLAVYYRVAGSSEGASYSWTVSSSSTGSVGGILSFRGVDVSSPVDAENGQTTANSLSHAAPSLTTTVANTMMVTSHTFPSSATWTPPSGMTEAADVASLTVPNAAGQALEVNYEAIPAAGSTGSKTATASGDADTGVTHSLALKPAAITFKSAAAASQGSGVLSLPIGKPSGTVTGDVMVAAIGFRPETATITPPSGWTLARRINNSGATANGLAIYYKVATASEPSSYTWTFSSSTGTAGGISAFSGVDTANPLDAENGQATASSLSHATPSITTTVANTMLVASFAFSSSATWATPSGMTGAFNVASLTVPNSTGESTASFYQFWTLTGSTGTRTATASGDADSGATHILALRPAP